MSDFRTADEMRAALAAAREENGQLREAWDADSKANAAVILLLRVLAAECGQWKDGLPAELIESCDAAHRSDWNYLRKRYPDPEAALAREGGGGT